MKAHKMKGRDLWQIKATHPSTRLRKTFYGSTKEEAERKAREFLQPKDTGFTDTRTFAGFYFNVYMPTILHLAPSTQANIFYMMDAIFLPVFGPRRLDSITRSEVQAFFNDLKQSAATKQIYRARFLAVLRLAKEDGLLSDVPKVRLAQPAPKTPRTLEFEGIARLIDCAEGEMKTLVMLCSLGLRISEALGVSIAHVAGGMLHVCQQRTTHGLTENLKTRNSERFVPLPFDLPEGLFACGKLTHPEAAYRFGKLAKCAKVDASPHSLRHAFISLLENELEAPTRIVSYLSGHAPKSVHEGYSHTKQTQLRKWIDLYWGKIDAQRARREEKKA